MIMFTLFLQAARNFQFRKGGQLFKNSSQNLLSPPCNLLAVCEWFGNYI